MRTHVDHTLTYDFCIHEVLWWLFMLSKLEIFCCVNLHQKTCCKSTDEHFKSVAATHPLTVNQSVLLQLLILPSRHGRSCRFVGKRVRWPDNNSCSSSSSTNTLDVQSSICNASLSLSLSPSLSLSLTHPQRGPAPPPLSFPQGRPLSVYCKSLCVYSPSPAPLWLTTSTITAAMAEEALINRLSSAN